MKKIGTVKYAVFPELKQLPNVGSRIHYLMGQRGFSLFSLSKALSDLGYEMSVDRIFYICTRCQDCKVSAEEFRAFKDVFCVEYSDLLGQGDGQKIRGLKQIPDQLGHRIKLLRHHLSLGGRLLFAAKVDIDFYRYERLESKNINLYPDELCRIQKVMFVTWQLLIEGSQF